MNMLLRLAGVIDEVTAFVARIARWALLANALLVVGNALARKFLAVAMLNAFDLQWHFFAAVVLLMAAYTLRRDEHVRVDLFAQRLGERGLAWLNLFGMALILIPLCLVMVWVTTPSLVTSILEGETRANRENSSDMPAWIIKAFIPVGFLLLALQGVAEGIRCVAILKGLIRRPLHRRGLIDAP